jgi:RNA 2',3'-cyclic 3'-phosphodiesterase
VTVRLFIALDLPPAIVEALVAWRAPLVAGSERLRAVAPEALHVTLCFLGERAQAAIEPLGRIVERVAEPAGGLALGGPLWLPRRRPRVLAAALEDHHGTLGALQERLMEALTADDWHAPDAHGSQRAYLPHVTVARVRDGAGPLGDREIAPPPPLAFEGAALTLYRSQLEPAGARYRAERRVTLA